METHAGKNTKKAIEKREKNSKKEKNRSIFDSF